jgi:hypothetical protein
MNNVPVFVSVQAATKGGLAVQYEHIKGFIPVSQLGPVSHTLLLGLAGLLGCDGCCIGCGVA